MSEIYDLMTVLSGRIVTSYGLIQRLDPNPASLADYCTEGASRWVAEAAWNGRPLPVNPATVQALRSAVARLDEVLGDAAASA